MALRCPRCGRWLADVEIITYPMRLKCASCHANVLVVPPGQFGVVLYAEVLTTPRIADTIVST